jgi:hypothetical protein
MNLIKFYENGENRVYAIAIDGKSYFFYSGFKSAEEAKTALIGDAVGVSRTLIEIGLGGEWSEIQ